MSDNERKLKQPILLNIYDRQNELEKELNRIDTMFFEGANNEAELAVIRAILPDFLAKMRAHPQVIIKPTTNIGGSEPLELDLIGMYKFFSLKVEEGMRLQPKRFLEESYRARKLFRDTIQAQPTPINIDLLGNMSNCVLEMQEEDVDGLNVKDILTATVYAQRLATVGHDIGFRGDAALPKYDQFVSVLDEEYLTSLQQQES